MNHPLPGVTFAQLKRIIVAYSMYPDPIVTSSKLSEFISKRIAPTEIARNSDFLNSIGLLEKTEKYGHYTVAPICKRLGEAIRKEPDNEKESSRIWYEIIRDDAFFNAIIQRVEFTESHSGAMKLNELKDNIISLSEFKDMAGYHVKTDYSLAVVYILKAAKIITSVDSKTIKLYKANLPTKFISPELVEELRRIKVKKFNLSRLICYCEQINDNYDWGHYEAVAFVTRSLMDHVPPIFSQPNFESIGSQTKQGKISSFKKSCDKLNSSLKHIADDLIHKQISAGVSLLVKEEIDFSQDLNTFLRRTLEELQSLQSQGQ